MMVASEAAAGSETAVVTAVSVGAGEVGEPAAGSSLPQAAASITIAKPMAPTLSREGLLDMASSLRVGRSL